MRQSLGSDGKAFKQVIATIQQLIPSLDDERLGELSARLDGCARKWSLELQAVVAAGPGVVIRAHQPAGENVVLKLGHDSQGFEAERIALEAFGARSSVRLLDSAPEHSALLLESVHPGMPLRSVTESGADADSCRIAAEMTTLLRVPATHAHAQQLPNAGTEAAETLARYSSFHTPAAGPLPLGLVEQAASLVKELNTSAFEPVVLHGDLHHDNILRSDRAGWLAIDPKGRIGDPAYEFAALMRNPIDFLVSQRHLRRLLQRRAEQLAAVSGCDRYRIARWAFAMAVVAACWQNEDGQVGWDAWLQVAEALD